MIERQVEMTSTHLGAQGLVKRCPPICVDHTAVVSMCTMELRSIMGVRRNKNCVPTFITYSAITVAKASTENRPVTVEIAMKVSE